MRILTYIIILFILIFGLTFAVLNAEAVRLDYYFGASHISLSLLLVAVLALGAVLGILALLGPLLKAKGKNYRLQNRVKQAEQEIENLRSIPIQDSH